VTLPSQDGGPPDTGAPDTGAPDTGAGSWDSYQRADEPASFLAMIRALRTLQDRMTAASPPEEVASRIEGVLTALADALGEYAVDETEQVTGRVGGVPGRGQAMAPVIEIEELTSDLAIGYVTFGRFYLGASGSVHGGAIPLAFDELMSRLANTGRPGCRTAYLHVDYRSVTPIETRLRIEARFESEEGRKRMLSASIRHGDTVCAEAEGLFVALRPGQP
jgi:acyl-coenzyme A thioesterase PaaI-like protein